MAKDKRKTKRKTKNRIRNRSVYKLRTRKRNRIANKNRNKKSRKKYGGELNKKCTVNDYRKDPLQKDDEFYGDVKEYGIKNTCASQFEYCKDDGRGDDVCTWRNIPYHAGWQRRLPHEY